MLEQPQRIQPRRDGHGALSSCSKAPGRDTAFAALALLRCRDRLQQVLDTIAEPRRSELARAAGEFDGCDDAHLKHLLAEVVRREDAALRDATARALGAGAAKASRAILRWAARGAGQ